MKCIIKISCPGFKIPANLFRMASATIMLIVYFVISPGYSFSQKLQLNDLVFWGENEYVIDICAAYVFLSNAVNDLVSK